MCSRENYNSLSLQASFNIQQAGLKANTNSFARAHFDLHIDHQFKMPSPLNIACLIFYILHNTSAWTLNNNNAALLYYFYHLFSSSTLLAKNHYVLKGTTTECSALVVSSTFFFIPAQTLGWASVEQKYNLWKVSQKSIYNLPHKPLSFHFCLSFFSPY